MPTNINTAAITGGVRVTWNDDAVTHSVEVWRKVDSADYALIDTVDYGVETYDDTITGSHTLKYKLRSKSGESYSSYAQKPAEAPLEFLFESNGDGSGLGYFGLEVNEDTTMTIDGNGAFYSDIDGANLIGKSFAVAAGETRSVCIRVTSGTAKLRIKNVIIKWGDNYTGSPFPNDGWNTSGIGQIHYDEGTFDNVPTCITDVSKMSHNTSINVFGLNRIYGDISAITGMTYLEIADGTYRHTTPGAGQASVTGDISLMGGLVTVDVWDDCHLTGKLTAVSHPLLERIWMASYSDFEVDLTGMDKLATISCMISSQILFTGDISGCVEMVFCQINNDVLNQDIDGSIAVLTELEYISIAKNIGSLSVPNVTYVTKLGYMDINGLVLTTENANQILADVWANRDVARVYSFRTLRLNKAGSEAPTGQGLTDLTNLRAYRSPNNDPAYNLWSIDVIT